ncbi:MAG: hypothetical protein PHQ90_09210 [Sulfuricurvum sp.]|uniref:hypothetical protein n=1 Tax=Sulfuricurvum sp. TaxID=2025608 RepID=UPI00260A4B73|nr:hypothetical protein [Sulfuricurvum sp.]MDD2369468.1 hypothetical protein [Sulfuricurvum sp.]MDD5117052.1 hypothetical protein [Sulfuricurvum sp.]
MRKNLFFFFCALALSGCLEREIFTEINDRHFVGHPPSALRIEDLSGTLKSTNDPNARVSVIVYIHSAHCTNAQSRSLGSDFDGYIRITIKENNTQIARAQMDYKGEPDGDKIRQVYDHLIQQLKW